MQKIKIGHRAKFRDRDIFFPQVLFPFRAILRRIFTSGVLHALLLIEIWVHSADACFLVMACLGYSRAQLRTLSSLLKDGAYYCYCAYVLRISRYSDFLSPMLTNTGIFLRGLKLSGESRS